MRVGVEGAWSNQQILAFLVEIISGLPGTGLFVYSGSPALGNPPIDYITAPGVTNDPAGNALPTTTGGFTSVRYTLGTAEQIAQLSAGILVLLGGLPASYAQLGGISVSNGSDQLAITAPELPGHATPTLFLTPSATQSQITAETGQFLVSTPGGPADTSALLEVQGEIATTGTVEAIIGGALETWHNASLNAGFAAFGGGYNTPGYQYEPINGGRVRLRGLVSLTAAEAASTAIFTLPAGYVPAKDQLFLTPSTLSGANLGGTIEVVSNGQVQIFTAGALGNYVALDGIVIELD